MASGHCFLSSSTVHVVLDVGVDRRCRPAPRCPGSCRSPRAGRPGRDPWPASRSRRPGRRRCRRTGRAARRPRPPGTGRRPAGSSPVFGRALLAEAQLAACRASRGRRPGRRTRSAAPGSGPGRCACSAVFVPVDMCSALPQRSSPACTVPWWPSVSVSAMRKSCVVALVSYDVGSSLGQHGSAVEHPAPVVSLVLSPRSSAPGLRRSKKLTSAPIVRAFRPLMSCDAAGMSAVSSAGWSASHASAS